MTTARFVPLLLLAALSACTAEPGPAGTVYGSPAAQAPTLAVADVLARAAELEGQPVRVEGLVTDVCANRGCWIRIADESGPAEIQFKVDDGVMTFPMDAKGRWAVADGRVKRIPLSLEATRERLAHEAEEAGRPFDPASVTEPLVVVRLDGVGAVIRESR